MVNTQDILQNRGQSEVPGGDTEGRIPVSSESPAKTKEEEWEDIDCSNAGNEKTEEEWTLLGLPVGEA